ncbi:hypothetical protein Q8A67_004594 [Cirrhinus molitorella]|uniref:Uncharacterized protein n=1 Tax=Cirrhinus molitorella TaxID=172907 RepID=A0AA88Q9Z4_9TELE|nr:hypothetical protein Q8A67_004594 [Cirrhinus molitorella]
MTLTLNRMCQRSGGLIRLDFHVSSPLISVFVALKKTRNFLTPDDSLTRLLHHCRSHHQKCHSQFRPLSVHLE